VKHAERRGFGRIGPIFAILIVIFGLTGIFFALMLPRVMVQIQYLFRMLPDVIDLFSGRFAVISETYLGYNVFTEWRGLVEKIVPQLGPPAANVLDNLFSGTLHAIHALVTVSLVPILTFYFLKDFYRLNEKLMELVPRRYLSDVREITRRISLVLGGLIRGQFLVCIILATYYSIAFSALRLEMPLLLGVFAGFMNLVPFVGLLFSLLLTMAIALLAGGGWVICGAILGVFLVANLSDTTILTPKIVGTQMGIGPLTIILTLLAGGELLGFLGVLLALPMLALVKALGGFFLERYYDSSFYKEESVQGKQTLSDQI
jgi:predicted PurR-regulated permease PerM